MKRITVVAAALGLAASLSAASAQALTFADYGAANSDANLDWTQSTSMTSGVLSTTASDSAMFSFLAPGLTTLANLPATFTLSATAPAVDPAVSALGQVAQQNLSGTFSFTYNGSTPLVVGSHTFTTGANLLSGTFSGAELVGPANGSTSSLQDAIFSGGSVSYASDFATFASTGDKGFSLDLTSVLPFFGATPGNALNSFTAVSTGSFASDISSGGGAGGVPEPMTWAMMLLGFGGIGVAARRKRRLQAHLAA
ncbi:MAG TPA: PEPxxWA-CTERM sorting domain-containing protein [Caulobacteraceae bacterium]|jgi:hypothetical protein|nr:PEPxxWA-CTERM sorting domain-containing protein [Caulobacteraceae bacterium]